MNGADQTQIFWDVTSPWYPKHPRRRESSLALLLETETSQILHSFLSISDTSLTAFCLSLFHVLFSSFPSSQIPFLYKCHFCAHKSLIPLSVSVSQLTPSYWLLLWRHEHLICGCPSLIAMIMAPLCAWVDWASWLIHRTWMQPYTLLNVQTAIWSWGRGFE
jgi:hypothetical protein